MFRYALEREGIEVVAVNDLCDSETIAHQLRYDSTRGPFPGEVVLADDRLVVNGHTVPLLSCGDPEALPWREHAVDVVIEATGHHTARAKAAGHLSAGAGMVVISAPSADADLSVVLGVNDHLFDPERHRVISNASCTTNCLAPMVKVLHDSFGVRKTLFTTVHPYTNNQSLLDDPHPDLRRARGMGRSMIPTSTTAVPALQQVMPEFAGKVHGMALRVPTAAVANIDLVAELDSAVDAAGVNDAFIAAAEGGLQGILGVNEEELVSCDFRGNRLSCILDAPFTQVVGENLVRILAWYDNEAGYASRLVDLMTLIRGGR
ncbi:type I glyceraldehyde-3-phosphate dehydrogenase [Geomonas sp. RF6]|nr:type I glyceraldehyde-3-phosphate dehydrogenase [Geomonas sp. RF6]